MQLQGPPPAEGCKPQPNVRFPKQIQWLAPMEKGSRSATVISKDGRDSAGGYRDS